MNSLAIDAGLDLQHSTTDASQIVEIPSLASKKDTQVNFNEDEELKEGIDPNTGIELEPILLQNGVPKIRVQQTRIRLVNIGVMTPRDLSECIYDYEHGIGPRKPFPGFGDIALITKSFHASMMMLKAHHDDPYDDPCDD